MSFPGPNAGRVWSRHWRRAVHEVKDQRGQAEAVCLGSSQVISVSWFTSSSQEEEESVVQARREGFQGPVDLHSPL